MSRYETLSSDNDNRVAFTDADIVSSLRHLRSIMPLVASGSG